MAASALPDNFIAIVLSAKYSIHDDLEIMTGGGVAVQIQAAGGFEDAVQFHQAGGHHD